MRAPFVLAGLALVSLSFAALGLAVPGGPAEPAVPDAVTELARPFPLEDVRLLDGPFHDAMARDQEFLLGLDPDRLLHNFRVNAGLPSHARPLGGWEAPDVELRGHSAGHYLSALSLMYASTGDERFERRADLIVTELGKVQAALPSRGFHEGYLSAFPEELFDRVEQRRPVWAPYYTLHKILAGLLDAYEHCGNRQALDMASKLAGWVRFRMDRLSHARQQAMLETEFGGMAEALANLYAITGNPEDLRAARLFDHDALFGPLAAGRDPLDGLHANTQIPKMIGAAREYELTGDERYRTIATTFWTRVAKYRSYANGGHSDDEHFFPVTDFAAHLGAESSETCNTYNMLKLTRHLFAWAPSAGLMDFYERGLYNHILASQDPATGGVIYYCPLKPGAFRTYSTATDSFWCCVGTGMENHAKYPGTIYFHSDDALFVNLFIPSTLSWNEKGLAVRQETSFPDGDTTHLRFTVAHPVRLAVKVRYPSWAVDGMTVTVNGHGEAVGGSPGSYITVLREWMTGDELDVRLPMRLRTEPLPGNPRTVAIFDGPVLLAGDLGRTGLDEEQRYGPSAPQLGLMAPVEEPGLIGSPADVVQHIVADGVPLTFHTEGVARPRDVTLLPFFRASATRYTVYWPLYSSGEWAAHQAATTRAEALARSRDARAIDGVELNDNAAETAHAFAGVEHTSEAWFEGRRGREAKGGAFGYALEVPADRAVEVSATYRGGDGRDRDFDVLVDGQPIATESLPLDPDQSIVRDYAVPAVLTRGHTSVTVAFRPHEDARTAVVLSLRILRAP